MVDLPGMKYVCCCVAEKITSDLDKRQDLNWLPSCHRMGEVMAFAIGYEFSKPHFILTVYVRLRIAIPSIIWDSLLFVPYKKLGLLIISPKSPALFLYPIILCCTSQEELYARGLYDDNQLQSMSKAPYFCDNIFSVHKIFSPSLLLFVIKESHYKKKMKQKLDTTLTHFCLANRFRGKFQGKKMFSSRLKSHGKA